MSDAHPVALVTGASAGLGAVFAEQLAQRGYDLILVARRLERLQQLAGRLPVRSECLSADLGDAAGRRLVCERLHSEPRLELLVNNAGFGTRGRFWEAPIEEQLQMQSVHVLATAELTHAALAGMVARRRGGVINVASVAAFSRSASNVSYCASKAWMLAFTEALSLELRGIQSPVKVQALCPGFTYTEFHDVMGVARDRIAKRLWMPADDVVRESLEGLDRGKLIVVPGWLNKVFVTLFPRLPKSWQMVLQANSPHTKGRL